MWNSVFTPAFCSAETNSSAFSTGTQSSGCVCQMNVGGVSLVTEYSSDTLSFSASQRSPSRHSNEPRCAYGPAVITGYESTCPFGRSSSASQPSASATNGRFQKLP